MQVFRDLENLPNFQNTVLTIGSFDGVHLGHRQILRRLIKLAKTCGGTSLVITFDPHPRTVLRPDDPDFKLISSTDEKLVQLAAEGIDNVVVVPFSKQFAEQSAAAYVEDFLLKKFKPRFVVIGYDHRFGRNREGDISMIKNYEQAGKMEVVEIPKQEVDDLAVSSTKIRKALDAANLPLAERLLGHRFQINGQVVQGNRIGRTIGFPTANLEITDSHKLVLPEGIYAAWTFLKGKKYESMLYIGRRPTLEVFENQVIEVNILNFFEEIYSEKLRVEPVEFIRPDEKIADLEQLKNRIAEDKKQIQERLRREELQGVAVVILNFNTRQHLEMLLPSVVRNTPPEVRIVVADNGSPDDSVDFLKKNYAQRVEIVAMAENAGFAEGYNRALRQVEAEFYFILNSDVELTEGWLEPLLEAMRADENLAVVQPKVLAFNEKERFEHAGGAGGWLDSLGYPFCRGRIFEHVEVDAGQYDSPQECFWASGAAFFVRADLYHSFGGFDADFFAHYEEIDLCWQFKRAGFSVACEPKSKVFHIGGGTLGYESPRKTFLNVRNSLFSMVKNEPLGKLLWALPVRMLLDWLAALVFLLKGRKKSAFAIFPAHLDFQKNWRRAWTKRRETAVLIEKLLSSRLPNLAGIFSGSIVFRHYVRRVKEFSKLKF